MDAETATAGLSKVKGISHALTSEKETAVAFNARVKELGLFWDKVLKKYTAAPEEKKEAE